MPDMENKIEKMFCVLEEIAFELISLNTHSYGERILVIGCQYVSKQSQDFRYYSDRLFRTDALSDC